MRRTYLPRFAQLLHGLGKYAYKHQADVYTAIDGSTKLTDDEKQAARKAVEDVLAAHAVFRKIWLDYEKTWFKGDWVP